MFALTLAIAFALQSDLSSEAPLAISIAKATPEAAVQYNPVEIDLDLKGTWKNPFDPKDIDVSAAVVGPRDQFAIVPGFLTRDYTAVIQDGKEFLSPAGPPKWKVRFSPWTGGGFGVGVNVMDTLSTAQTKTTALKVKGLDEKEKLGAGFVETEKNKKYLLLGKRPFFPIGVIASGSEIKPGFFESLSASGANFCVLNLDASLGKIEKTFGWYDLAEAWKLERALDNARANGIFVLLSLNGADDMDLQKGWKTNIYNAANGGPCAAPEDFWTNLQARLQYKKKLRYIIARFNANPAFAGIQLFHGIEAPDYWLEEMSNEVFALHPYGVIVTSETNDENSFKLERLNVVMLSNPATAKKTSDTFKKPVLSPVSGGTVALWNQLTTGAAGAIIFKKDDVAFRQIADAAAQIEWNKRSFEVRDVLGTKGSAIIDDRGGILFVESGAGSARIVLKRGGTYKYAWRSITDGSELQQGEQRDVSGELTLSLPEHEGGMYTILERK